MAAVGDDSVAVGDDPMEESDRVDRGQLLGIPQQDRLAIAVPNQLGEAGVVFGGDHRHFVADHHRSRKQGVGSPVELVGEHRDGPCPVAAEILGQLLCSRGSRCHPDDGITLGLGGVGVGADGIGLLRSTRPSHCHQTAVELDEATDCPCLFSGQLSTFAASSTLCRSTFTDLLHAQSQARSVLAPAGSGC